MNFSLLADVILPVRNFMNNSVLDSNPPPQLRIFFEHFVLVELK